VENTIYTSYDVFLRKKLPFSGTMVAPARKFLLQRYFLIAIDFLMR